MKELEINNIISNNILDYFTPPLLFVMCYVPFNKQYVFFRPVNSVPGLCWAADAKLAGGGGSPWRHDSSSPAGGFAESDISSPVCCSSTILGYFWTWFPHTHTKKIIYLAFST